MDVSESGSECEVEVEVEDIPYMKAMRRKDFIITSGVTVGRHAELSTDTA